MHWFDLQQNFKICGGLGYGSENDGDFVDMDLCCACVDKLISECAIDPLEHRGAVAERRLPV